MVMSIVKWWKDKFWQQLVIISITTMLIAFFFTYFISWGWILSILIVCIGGSVAGKLIINRLKQLYDETSNTF